MLTRNCLTSAGLGAVPPWVFSYAWMTSAAPPATNGEDSLVPPLSSTSDGCPTKLVHSANSGLGSHEAKLRSPGAIRSSVSPVSSKPLELSELMLLFSQPVVAKSLASA